MDPELVKQLNDGLQAVLAKQGEINGRLEQHEKQIDARIKAIEDANVNAKEWLERIDKSLREGRFGRGDGRTGTMDAIREVLPDSGKRLALLHEMRGVKDPLAKAALDVWMRNAIRLQLPQFARQAAALIEQQDRLEKALGAATEFGAQFKAATQEDTDTEGGHAIPAPHAAEMLRLMLDSGMIRNLARVVGMTSKTLDYPTLNANVSAAIIAEEGSINQSDPTFTNGQLLAKIITLK